MLIGPTPGSQLQLTLGPDAALAFWLREAILPLGLSCFLRAGVLHPDWFSLRAFSFSWSWTLIACKGGHKFGSQENIHDVGK